MIQPSALFYARGFDRYLMILIPTAFLLYATSHPVNRLRVEMPTQFVDAPAGASNARWGTEAEIAQAYWNVAVTVIQWQYGFGSSLPAEPPANFRIDETLFGAAWIACALLAQAATDLVLSGMLAGDERMEQRLGHAPGN